MMIRSIIRNQRCICQKPTPASQPANQKVGGIQRWPPLETYFGYNRYNYGIRVCVKKQAQTWGPILLTCYAEFRTPFRCRCRSEVVAQLERLPFSIKVEIHFLPPVLFLFFSSETLMRETVADCPEKGNRQCRLSAAVDWSSNFHVPLPQVSAALTRTLIAP